MTSMHCRVASAIVGGVLFLGGCGSPQPDARTAGVGVDQPPAREAPPKRLNVVAGNEPSVLYYPLAPLSTRGGAGIVFDLLHPGLSLTDNEGALRPILVEDVPSLENGLWTLLADGRMQTTWRLRPGAVWHDGTPVTSGDLLFTLQVVRDRELPALGNRNYGLIEDAVAIDSRAITITWARPYIDADRVFMYQGTISFALPLPKHLLEDAYGGNKAGFLDLPYWGLEFVGFGPYRLGEWVQGSHITLRAFDQFALGPPKIDEVQARFIPDQNTIMSNVLAGAVDVFQGATLGVDQGLQLREQWREGTVNVSLNNWVVIYPQFIDPQPAAVLNPQFRKALLYAIDRQAMADTLMSGLVPVAHTPLDVNSREFKATESSLVRYSFDPLQASRLIEGMGYTRASDGIFRDSGGQRLAVEIRGAASRDIQVKGLFPVADNWQAVGVAAEPVVISAQQASDLRDQATFRSFQLVRQNYHLARLISYHSSEARLPERNHTGSNNGRYISPGLDALIERYQLTIPWSERMQVAGQILYHMTDQLPVMPLFYDMQVSIISNRVQGATPLLLPGGGRMWNAYEWNIS